MKFLYTFVPYNKLTPMKKAIPFTLVAVLILCFGCLKQNTENADNGRNDFSLLDKITVQSELPAGTRCLVFTDYPYSDEGDLVEEPVMTAVAPFNNTLPVAKHVETLYVYANGALREYPRGDISIKPASAASASAAARALATTRAGETDEVPMSRTTVDLSPDFVRAIHDFYPEAQVNLTPEQRKICTDLVATEGEKSPGVMWGNTKIWITYVSNGGSNIIGDLWYYTYRVDENLAPTTSYEAMRAQPPVRIFNRITPAGIGTRVYLGEFEPGTRIGFIFKGNSGFRYSTPQYTNAEFGQAVTCGVTRIWEYEGKQYATLGFENRLPTEAGWDGDYNDMICLVEATPLAVENTVDPPIFDPETIKWQGYWLFEDNFPYKGDYDFNDLVVKYAITEYKGQPTVVDLQFLAKGAYYKNQLGVNGVIYFNEVNGKTLDGYENVLLGSTPVTPVIKEVSVPANNGVYIPMLDNGKVRFDLNTFNQDNTDFPCVLEIPYNKDRPFRWCLESKRIDSAYPRYKKWVDSRCTTDTDWYLDTPVDGLVW